MSDCGECKDKRLKLYMTKYNDRQQTVEALVRILDYTEKQAGYAIDFTDKRGQCLIHEENREKVVKLIEKFIAVGVYCEARGNSGK